MGPEKNVCFRQVFALLVSLFTPQSLFHSHNGSILTTWFYLDGELELVVELGQQQVVAQRLPHLHDPHDGGVDLVLAVLEHSLLGRLLLVIRLFQLNLKTKRV